MSNSNIELCFASTSDDNKTKCMSDDNQNHLINSCAVRVSNLMYAYSSRNNNLVLNKCSINVPKGKIYALLGSNGCGKTTLINCIIGKFTPHSGHIQTFGLSLKSLKKNQIGFMPQNLSILNDFTIEENLLYFARIYGLNDQSVAQKISEMRTLFDMPEKSRIVSQLSGGQQRIVSLCVALIHSPMLVLLDEPTVGVDPILRHEIWQYFDIICKNNSVTIVITTHYIEEARNASTVAYLRDGQIMVEQNPEILLIKYACNTLEDVFLKLCNNNITDVNEKNVLIPETSRTGKVEYNCVKFEQIHALLIINTLRLYRCDRVITLFCLLMPAILISAFYITFVKHTQKYSLSVYNSDKIDTFTRAYIKLLDNQQFDLDFVETKDSLINSVIDGKSKAGLMISSKNTSQSSGLAISYSSINVYLEITQILDTLVIPLLHQTYINALKTHISSNGLNYSDVSETFQQILIYGNTERSIFDYAIPSLIMFSLFGSAMTMTLMSLIGEKNEGVFERTLIAGVSSFSYYFAYLMIRCVFLSVHVLIFLLMITPVLINYYVTNIFSIYCLSLSHGITAITLSIFITTLISGQFSGMTFLFFWAFLYSIIGGICWPIEALPGMVQYIGKYVLPLSLPAQSMHSILNRGWSIDHYTVWIAFVSNTVFASVYFCLALFVSHIKSLCLV